MQSSWKNPLKALPFLLMFLAYAGGAFGAAGRVQFVIGDVKLITPAGVTRALQKGAEVNEGDRVVSAANSSAQIKMVDGGFIAIRPNTDMAFDKYRFSGKEDGKESALLSLLRGGFRTITGLIGHTNKKNYLIRTETATIGIRGTDHEPMVILPPAPGQTPIAEPGTYDKVNVGVAFIRTDAGSVDIQRNQVGFAPATKAAPVILPKIPSFYKPTPEPKEAKEEGKEKAQSEEQKTAATSSEKSGEEKKEETTTETAAASPESTSTSESSSETSTTASAETTTTTVSDTTIRDTSVVDTTATVIAAPTTFTTTLTTAPVVVAPVIQTTATSATGTTLNATTQTTTTSTGTTVPVSVVLSSPAVSSSNYSFGIMAVKPVSGGVERSDYPTSKIAASPNTDFVLSGTSLVEIKKAPYERFGINYDAQLPIASADIKFSGGAARDESSDPNGVYYMGRWAGGQIDVKDLASTSPVAPFTDTLGASSAHWIIGLAPGNLSGSPSINGVQQLLGTANYTLAAGTHPTDSFGNVGTLNSASLTANFTAQTVDADLNLSFSSSDAANPSTRNLSLTANATNVPIVNAQFDASRDGHYAPTVSCTGPDCATSGYTGYIGGMFLSTASGGSSTGAVGTGAAIGYGFTPDIPSPTASQPFADYIQGVAVLNTGTTPSLGTPAAPVSGGTGTYRHHAIGAQTIGSATYNSNYNLASGISASAQNYLFDASGNLVRIQSTDYKLSDRGTSGPPSYTNGDPVPYTGTPGSNPSSPLTGAVMSFSGGSNPDGNYNDTVNGIRLGRYSGGMITTTDFSNASDPLTYYTQLGSNSFNWAVRELPASIPLTGSVEFTNAFGTKPIDSLGNVGTLNYASLTADFDKQVVSPAVGITINNQNLFSAATNVPIGGDFSFDVASNPANNSGGGTSTVEVMCYGSNCAPPPVGSSRAYGGRFSGGFGGSGTAGGAFFRYDINTHYDPAVAAGSTDGIPTGETRPVNDYIQGEVAFLKGTGVAASKPADAVNGGQAISTTFFAYPASPGIYYENWGGSYQTTQTSYTSPFGVSTTNKVADYDPTETTQASETLSDGATQLAPVAVAVAPTNANSASVTGISFGRYTGGTVSGNKFGGSPFDLANQGSYVWIKGPQSYPTYLEGALTGKATYVLDGGTAPAITSATATNGTTGTLNGANLVVDFASAAVGVDLSVTANSSTFIASTGGAFGTPNPTLKLQGDQQFFGSTFNASTPALHESLNVTVNGTSASYYQGQIRGQLMGSGLNGAGLTYMFQDNFGSGPGVGVNGAVAFVLDSYKTNSGAVTNGSTAIDPDNAAYVLGVMASGLDSSASSLDSKYLAYADGNFQAPARMPLDAATGIPTKWDADAPVPIPPVTCTSPCVSTPGFVAKVPARYSIDSASFVPTGSTPGSGQVALPTGKSPATVLESGFDPATGIRWGRYGNGVVAVFDRVGGGFSPKTVDLTSQNWHGIFGPLQTGPTALPTTGTFTYTKVGGTSPTDNLGSAPGTLNAATLVADFAAQTVNAGVNLTVNGQTWAAGANSIPIQDRLHFDAAKDLAGGNLNVCVGATCGTVTIPASSSANTTGALMGGFIGSTGQGAGMAYSLNQGSVTVSGVAAFKR